MKMLSRAWVLGLSAFVIQGCSHAPVAEPKAEETKTLVLIQGVHLDGSVWKNVQESLEAAGQKTMTLDRVGRDTARPASLSQIAARSCEMIPSASILVAHSYGGAIANAMLGVCADKVAKIIYVSAVIPLRGEKPFDRLTPENQKEYAKAVDFKKPKIVPKKVQTFFKITDSVVDVAKPLPALYAEWMSLTAEPVEFDPARLEALPKSYIFTGKDKVVTPESQRAYVEALKIRETGVVETGHFPMLSDPQNVAKLIGHAVALTQAGRGMAGEASSEQNPEGTCPFRH